MSNKFELTGINNWTGLKNSIIVYAATAEKAVMRAQTNHSQVNLTKSST